MQFNLNLSPPGVVDVIAWSVSQYILVAQLHADLGRNVRQIMVRISVGTEHWRDLLDEFTRALA